MTLNLLTQKLNPFAAVTVTFQTALVHLARGQQLAVLAYLFTVTGESVQVLLTGRA